MKILICLVFVFLAISLSASKSFAVMECHTFATPGGPRTVCVQVPDPHPLSPSEIEKWWEKNQLFPNHFKEYEQ